jgi:hypothetical protein
LKSGSWRFFSKSVTLRTLLDFFRNRHPKPLKFDFF